MLTVSANCLVAIAQPAGAVSSAALSSVPMTSIDLATCYYLTQQSSECNVDAPNNALANFPGWDAKQTEKLRRAIPIAQHSKPKLGNISASEAPIILRQTPSYTT
ncbi:hypothetical protein BDN71DRAFT_1458682 [Pleurotus eryngii]|uniref:Uncharacterized protein n=1 Tax=Pleurotus eryngii TaxID=5323 RepID=A0A9P6D1A8_PLEER|nr:hypothetical protein BDN71DRAFT_1458682 [Pleurotus eryngii]